MPRGGDRGSGGVRSVFAHRCQAGERDGLWMDADLRPRQQFDSVFVGRVCSAVFRRHVSAGRGTGGVADVERIARGRVAGDRLDLHRLPVAGRSRAGVSVMAELKSKAIVRWLLGCVLCFGGAMVWSLVALWSAHWLERTLNSATRDPEHHSILLRD